jgi:hypothetical protein
MYGGGVIFSNKRKSTFMRQCQYAQASQPMVAFPFYLFGF